MASRSGPGLKDFLQRAKTLQTYRQFLRLAQQLPKSTRAEVTARIRDEFRLGAASVDAYSVRAAMAEASRQMNILASYVGTATVSGEPEVQGPSAQAPRSSTSVSGGVQVDHVRAGEESATDAREEVYEGRVVGRGWPWGRPQAGSSEDGAPSATRHFGKLYSHRLPH